MKSVIKLLEETSSVFSGCFYSYFYQEKKFFFINDGVTQTSNLSELFKKALQSKDVTQVTSNSKTGEIFHIIRPDSNVSIFLKDTNKNSEIFNFIKSLITLILSDGSISVESENSDTSIEEVKTYYEKELSKRSIELNKVRKKFREESIILEEQAKEAFNKYDDIYKRFSHMDLANRKMHQQLQALAQQNKKLMKDIHALEVKSDFRVNMELKKRNDTLVKESNDLFEGMKTISREFDEFKSNITQAMENSFGGLESNSKITEFKDTLKELTEELNQKFIRIRK